MGLRDWQHVEELFHAAAALPAAERDAHLARACSGDVSLRAEVESLLAALDDQPDFMERPAFSLGMKVLSEASGEESLVGKTVGPYKVLRLLGKGGMGTVYLADDERLERKVALKFLAHKFLDDVWAKRQLKKEAQAVANLDHPNICTVYGLEEGNGHSFMVMQYVAGETLASLTRAGMLTPGQIPDLAVQIARALLQAHSHGIIHRDVKPQNIIVTAGGQVKVLDFGLAKAVQQRQGALAAEESQMSQQGLVIGTIAYMSPEQLRAERLDFRSDIFSFGTVLYEMISGKNPYARASDAETISAILTSEITAPAQTAAAAQQVPPELIRIALKCLAKDKEKRYPSASELLYDLDNLRATGAAAAAPHRPPLRVTFGAAAPAVAAFVLLFLLAAVSLLAYLRPARVHTLAVLPIVNESNDPQLNYLGDGLTESLIKKLYSLPALRVKALTTVSGYKGQGLDARQIGRDLQVEAVLVGKLVRNGDALALQTKLVNTADGSPLLDESYDVKLEKIFDLHTEVSEKVASSLELRLGRDEKNLLAAQRIKKPEALQKYMLGRYYLNRRNEENILTAIRFFEEAIVFEPTFAEAHAGLADCYVFRPSALYGGISTQEAMRKAKGEAGLALSLDDNLPEAHTSMGIVQLRYEWNWAEAEREFKRAIALNPDYAAAHNGYSNLLVITGRFSEAIAESEKSKNLDPSSPSETLNHCRAIFLSRQYDRAEACFKEMLGKWPESFGGRYILGLVYQEQGRHTEALGIFQKLYAENKKSAATLGYVYGRMGKKAEALKLLNELIKRYKNEPSSLPAQEIAVVYVGLGDNDKAFDWLEKACDEKFAPLTYLAVEPLFDGLRSDPRYEHLLRRLNLSPPV